MSVRRACSANGVPASKTEKLAIRRRFWRTARNIPSRFAPIDYIPEAQLDVFQRSFHSNRVVQSSRYEYS